MKEGWNASEIVGTFRPVAGRGPSSAHTAVVALTALQPLLLLLAGDLHFEAVHPFAILLLFVALIGLARGSRTAWAALIALNALPLLAALPLAVKWPISFTTDLVILLATSGPLIAVLLSRPMRRRLAAR